MKPVVAAILAHPAVYLGPRMVKPPIVLTAGLLRRLSAGDHHDRLGVDRRRSRASSSSTRRTSRAGTTRAGSTRRPSAAASSASSASSATRSASSTRARRRRPPTADEVLATRAQVLGRARRSASGTHYQLLHVREARDRRCRQGRRPAEAVPRDGRAGPTPADRRVPRPPDRMSNVNNLDRIVCDECTRAEALRAVAGQGLPAIEPGMPLPAGTGLSRRSFVAKSLGLALSVYGVGQPRPLRRGDRRGGCRRSRPGRSSSTSSWAVAQTRSRCSIRTATRSTGSSAPTLAVDGGTPFTEDPRLFWHPALAPLATLHDEGKVTVMPSIGYDHPDQSHFTSRHYWEVGATDAHLLTGWLGRYLDVVGNAGQPAAGPLDDRFALADARHGQGAGRGDRRARASTTSTSPASGARSSTRMLDAMGALGDRALA